MVVYRPIKAYDGAQWVTVGDPRVRPIETEVNGRLSEASLSGTFATKNELAEVSVGEVDVAPLVASEVESRGLLTSDEAGATFAHGAAIQRPGATVCAVPTPDGNPNTTHPSVVDFGDGQEWNGYRYWLAHTPFPNDFRENPCVAASNDGVNFEVPEGAPTELATIAEVEGYGRGYNTNSDTELIVLPDGRLACYWRPKGAGDGLWRKTTTDGRTWSGAEECLHVTTNTAMSPTVVVEDDGTFSLWTVNDTTQTVERRTSSDGVTFAAPTTCTLPATSPRVWHLQVRKVDDTYHMLLNSYQGVGLFYLTSTDGTAWEGRTGRVLPTINGAPEQYRSTFVPRGGDPLRWDVWVATKKEGGGVSEWRVALLRDVDLSAGLLRDQPNVGQYFIPAAEFRARVGSPALDYLGYRYPAWLLDASAVETVSTAIQVPWPSVLVEVVWAQQFGGTAQGDVAWQIIINSQPFGQSVETTDADRGWNIFTGSAPAGGVVTTTLRSPAIPVVNKYLASLQVQRRATEASDTFPADALFLGVVIYPGDRP